MEVDELLSLNPDDEWWTGLWQHVMIHDTRSGNRSCDGSGDLSPTFSMFVYVCLCLFTCVWSLDLFWKLYIVPMLRELTSLSFNINYDILITCLLSEVDLVTGGPAHKLSPSLPLGSQFQLWGNQLLQEVHMSVASAILPSTPYHYCEHWE